jgi:hypothetical protein
MTEKKIREVFYSEEFNEFFARLEHRVREKYIWTIRIVETVRLLPTNT